MRPPELRTFVAVVVTGVWAGLYTAAIVHPKFTPPPEVSPIMLAIVVWLFAVQAKRK